MNLEFTVLPLALHQYIISSYLFYSWDGETRTHCLLVNSQKLIPLKLHPNLIVSIQYSRKDSNLQHLGPKPRTLPIELLLYIEESIGREPNTLRYIMFSRQMQYLTALLSILRKPEDSNLTHFYMSIQFSRLLLSLTDQTSIFSRAAGNRTPITTLKEL